MYPVPLAPPLLNVQRGAKEARTGARRPPVVQIFWPIHRKGKDRPSGEFLVREQSSVEDAFAFVAQHNVVIDAARVFNEDGKFAALACGWNIQGRLTEPRSRTPMRLRSRYTLA